MKLYSQYKSSDGLSFIIEDVGYMGVYFYVFDSSFFFSKSIKKEEKCVGHIRDHHQDTVAMAQKFGQSHFSVPLDSWVEVR